ncbi:MAG: Ig-like domain-containing protein [Candidatus Krumholzibacteria bacterium]
MRRIRRVFDRNPACPPSRGGRVRVTAISLMTMMLIAIVGCGGDDPPPVAVDTKAPTVTSMSPAAGAMNVSLNTTISATFSEAVRASTVNATTFTVGGVLGTVVLNGKVATFTPSAALAESTPYTVTITTGVKDIAGNALAADFVWSFTTLGTAPVVASVSPLNGAMGVSLTSTVSATFSEAVDPATVTATTFTVSGVTGTISVNGATATFTPSAALAESTPYTATVTTGITDLAGNALAADFVWSFTTGSAPIANAGPDQDVTLGVSIVLDGSASQGDFQTRTWAQVSGPTVVLTNPTSATPTIPNPPNEVTTMEFDLTLTFGGQESRDRVVIFILEDADNALFVSRTGSDANAGTRQSPFATVQKAIDVSNAVGGGADVYATDGVFSETITLRDNVSIYGGFHRITGLRDIQLNKTIINGGPQAVTGSSANNLTLDGLEILSAAGHGRWELDCDQPRK